MLLLERSGANSYFPHVRSAQILFCLPNVVNFLGGKTFSRKSWYFIVTAQALYYKDGFVFFLLLLRVIFSWRLDRPRFKNLQWTSSFLLGWDILRVFSKGRWWFRVLVPVRFSTQKPPKKFSDDVSGWAFKGDDMFPWGRLGLKSWCKHVKFVS